MILLWACYDFYRVCILIFTVFFLSCLPWRCYYLDRDCNFWFSIMISYVGTQKIQSFLSLYLYLKIQKNKKIFWYIIITSYVGTSDWCWHSLTPNTTATHCNTLHHTATRCNKLQHTATHCTSVGASGWCWPWLTPNSSVTQRLSLLLRGGNVCVWVTHLYIYIYMSIHIRVYI